MKKRFLTMALALILLCSALPVFALADVIWEPEGNNFYDQHRDECKYENEGYIVNGEAGNIKGCDKPDGQEKAAFENGFVFSILFTYDNAGEIWGITEYKENENDDWKNAWVKMNELVKVYDGEDFLAEHKGELTAPEGGEAVFKPEAEKEYFFYTYPCSGEEYTHFEAQDEDEIYYENVFTDPDGRQWAYVGYHYGARGIWLCLSDPYNGNIPASLKHDYGDVFYEAKTPEPVKNTGVSTAVIMAAAAVVIAGVCIAVFWKKKK